MDAYLPNLFRWRADNSSDDDMIVMTHKLGYGGMQMVQLRIYRFVV
jgi:hypothetical protein